MYQSHIISCVRFAKTHRSIYISHAIYSIYIHFHRRCLRLDSRRWTWLGGKGISLCAEDVSQWHNAAGAGAEAGFLCCSMRIPVTRW